MKILLINNQHYQKGGAHNVYFNTAKLLEDNRHSVFFYSMQDDHMIYDVHSNYFPRLLDYRKQSFLSKFKLVKKFVFNKDASERLKDYIDYIKPDVAHVHLFMGGLTVSILKALKEKSIPVVHSVHDYRLICPSYLFLDGKLEICERCKGGYYYNCLKHKCSEKSLSQSFILTLDAYNRKYINNPTNYISKLIFVSNFAKKKHDEFGLNSANAVVIYNFMLNMDKVIPSNFKGDYLLYFGRLSREKGVLTLLNALKPTKLRMIIVGEGPLKSTIEKNKGQNIKVVGFKKGRELEQLIKKASFIIVPSEWYENNPMTIIEAYSYGKPVIGASIGGIPEIIVDGKTGYLFESNNIESLKEKIEIANRMSSDEYSLMSENARKFAEAEFNPNKQYNKLINAYKEVVNKGK
jgi:glycosyltransferase involved in cell wall biosynthesis